MEQARTCRRCSLSQKCQGVVCGEGSKSQIMVVTSGITLDGDRDQAVFGGLERELFNRILESAELTMNDIYLTSLVKCVSYEKRGRIKLKKDYEEHEINSCKHWLWQEFQWIDPKVVIVMGKLAAVTLLDVKKSIKLKALLGQELKVSYLPNAILIPTYAINTLLNQSDWWTTVTSTYFKRAKELCVAEHDF